MLPKNAHRNARMRKAWLNRLEQIITSKSICSKCGCNKENNTLQVNHLTRDAYKEENYHLYEIISEELPYEIICKRCHFSYHNNMTICPKCNKNYKHKQYSTCFKCSGKKVNEFQQFYHDILLNKFY